MKTRRALFMTIVLSLVAASTVILVRGSVPVGAASATTTLFVPISGTVGGLPESVHLVGLAKITSTPAKNAAGLPVGMTLFVDLTNVVGQGLSTGTTYVSKAQTVVLRRFVANDLVEISFPFFPSGPDGFLSARPALASFSLTYNVMTGQLTTGTAVLATPNF